MAIKETIYFPKYHFNLAGTLYLPENFDKRKSSPAIVISHPSSGNMEQTSGKYAEKLANEGFVTLAFDAAYQGQSAGEPRYLEDPSIRSQDISFAIDYLNTLPFVDDEKIGAVGICAGGGYTLNTAKTDKRIKAVGTIAAANVGTVYRENFSPDDQLIETLVAIAKQRTAEAKGAEPLITQWIPNSPEELQAAGYTDIDYLEAVDYYRTSRGQSAFSPNKLRFISLANILGFDALHLAEKLLTQPLQIIVGNKVGGFGSYRTGLEVYHRAASKNKQLLVLDDVSHCELYDQPEIMKQVVTKLSSFFREFL